MTTLDRQKLERLCNANTKSIQEMALKLTEEVGEVAQAILSFTGAQGNEYKAKGRDDVIEELVDVTMVVESLLHRFHVSDARFNSTFNQKLDKWEEKIK
ncbi:hypothetical protein BCPG3_141 [Bacillus phage BCPG3]|uniref:Putative MazG nucleotide pyrophosphohydrolase n=2 Tax=Wphvirus TaxID=1922327 RepID=W5QUJ9_9CAUD|nr:MazG-like family protein [Bacillus thuringiensis]YP_006907716.1 MazG-like pyrophosphatase [Bacillus phage BPS13]YP_009003042.1 MazG-like pyrophosphatase [Bacillus phage BPS10C]QQO38851.1 hypothetical protein BCPG1_120 [Bacillus phage BCPG1]QSJ04458.1 hypothetical protein BCPG3_141 [Bacillus phage BCPG3]QSJ04668.1 hypothetical protein BCP18_136 [Bacillus phage BCP18]AEZ50336.1 putative MazG nucleotide pyrophosphohydrolase [Bacillus phage BPS13]AGI12153.1 putative MazG nucleotide pyrophosph